jgi:hypothetical protein
MKYNPWMLKCRNLHIFIQTDMLTISQMEHVKCFLRQDWMTEEQLSFVVEQIICFTATGYECFIQEKRSKKK